MCYVDRLGSKLVFVSLVLWFTMCGNVSDDLFPSANDERIEVEAGSNGNMPGQMVLDFSIPDSKGNEFVLTDYLSAGEKEADVIVLYFTMWCPVCLGHSDHLYNYVIPAFKQKGNLVFVLVDYVSGSVEGSRLAEIANGYNGSDFIVLSDIDQMVRNQFNAAMGSVVILDRHGMILINEDYRDGSAVIATLDEQFP